MQKKIRYRLGLMPDDVTEELDSHLIINTLMLGVLWLKLAVNYPSAGRTILRPDMIYTCQSLNFQSLYVTKS